MQLIHLRLDEKLIAALDREAARQERSRTWVVGRLLRRALKEWVESESEEARA